MVSSSFSCVKSKKNYIKQQKVPFDSCHPKDYIFFKNGLKREINMKKCKTLPLTIRIFLDILAYTFVARNDSSKVSHKQLCLQFFNTIFTQLRELCHIYVT